MSQNFPEYYILVGRTPMAVDMDTWARTLESRRSAPQDPWRVANDVLEGCSVSTVFLGLNHNFFGGEPVLFESMVFGGPLADTQLRYRTYAEAERGHAALVEEVKAAVAQVQVIAEAAGATKVTKPP